MFLPNKSAISGDARTARVGKVMIEFQVVESCPAGFIIGRDATKGYNMSIDENTASVVIHSLNPPLRIPITEGEAYGSKKVDPRVFANETIFVPPFGYKSVEIRFEKTNDGSDVLCSPVRFANIAEGTYASASYSILSNNTTHITIENPSPRPVKIRKNQLVGIYEPILPNSKVYYLFPQFNTTAVANASAPAIPPSVATITPSNAISTPPLVSSNAQIAFSPFPTSPAPIDFSNNNFFTANDGHIDIVPATNSTPMTINSTSMASSISTNLFDSAKPTLDLNATTTTWHDSIDDSVITDELIDPFGLEHEFRDKGPLKPHPPDDSDATSESAVKRPPKWDINPALPREVRKRFKKMLQKQQKVFAGIERRLGKIDKKFDMKIDADISQLRSAQPYRTSPAKRKLIQSAIKELLDKDVIQPSSSPFASPVVVVIQKGKPRFCIDLREVNNKTIADRYALPKQDSIFHALRGSIIFTIIDANKGYHQFGLTFDSRKLTAFITEDGFYEFKRIPFGLKNAPAHFQRAMDTILANYRWDFALAYIDDIIIFSKSADEHILHVQLVLEALIKVGMTVDENKCHFGYEEIELLGHRVNRLGLSTQPQKVKAITDLPFPRTIKHGHQVVGQFNYYREFIKNYAEIAEPLTTALSFKSTTAAEKPKSSERDLKKEYRLRSTNPFPDNTATRTAFERLKTAISSAPVLIHPNFDKPFSLYVDASRIGIGCALHQVSDVDNKEHPVLFVSRVLRPAEKNYSATELECLGVVWSLHKLEHYVDGAQIKIFTDHSALKWIWNLKSTVNSRLFRWSLILNPLQHKVTIVHRPGRLHNNVDPLSRNPSNSVYTNVNLYYARDEYVDKLWSGYLSDRYFRTILQQLIRHNLPKGGSPSLNPSLASLASLTSPSRPPPSNLGPPADASLAVTELRRQPTQRSIQNGTTPTNVATPTYVTTRSAKISPTHPKESAHDETSESPPPAKSQTVDEDEVVQESGQTKESTEHEVSKDKDDANILLEYVDTLKDNGKEMERLFRCRAHLGTSIES